MTSIRYELPHRTAPAPRYEGRLSCYLRESDVRAMKQIAEHQGVSLSELTRSFIQVGLQMAIQQLKEQETNAKRSAAD